MQFIPCLSQNPRLWLVNYDISVQQTVAMDSIISGSDTNFKWLFYIEVLIPLVSSCVISRVGYCLFNNCIPALKRKFWVQNNKRETFVISLESWSAETGYWQVMLKALCVHGLNNMEFYSYLLSPTRKQVTDSESAEICEQLICKHTKQSECEQGLFERDTALKLKDYALD